MRFVSALLATLVALAQGMTLRMQTRFDETKLKLTQTRDTLGRVLHAAMSNYPEPGLRTVYKPHVDFGEIYEKFNEFFATYKSETTTKEFLRKIKRENGLANGMMRHLLLKTTEKLGSNIIALQRTIAESEAVTRLLSLRKQLLERAHAPVDNSKVSFLVGDSLLDSWFLNQSDSAPLLAYATTCTQEHINELLQRLVGRLNIEKCITRQIDELQPENEPFTREAMRLFEETKALEESLEQKFGALIDYVESLNEFETHSDDDAETLQAFERLMMELKDCPDAELEEKQESVMRFAQHAGLSKNSIHDCLDTVLESYEILEAKLLAAYEKQAKIIRHQCDLDALLPKPMPRLLRTDDVISYTRHT